MNENVASVDLDSFLVVDDDTDFRRRLAKAIRARGNKVFEAANGDEALSVLQEYGSRKMILDLKMPGSSGLEVLKSAKAIIPDCEVVILTGYGSIATAIQAVKDGAQHYLTKPTDPDAILDSFSKVSEVPTPKGAINSPSLEEVEWQHIQRVMVDCDGNVSKASKALGIHRRSLQRKLKRPPEGMS